MVHNGKCVTIFQNLCLFLRLQYLPLIEAIFWEHQLVGLMFQMTRPKFFGSFYYKLAHVSCLGTIWSNDFFLQNQKRNSSCIGRGHIYSSRLLQYNKSETLSLEKEAFIVFLSTSLDGRIPPTCSLEKSERLTRHYKRSKEGLDF